MVLLVVPDRCGQREEAVGDSGADAVESTPRRAIVCQSAPYNSDRRLETQQFPRPTFLWIRSEVHNALAHVIRAEPFARRILRYTPCEPLAAGRILSVLGSLVEQNLNGLALPQAWASPRGFACHGAMIAGAAEA